MLAVGIVIEGKGSAFRRSRLVSLSPTTGRTETRHTDREAWWMEVVSVTMEEWTGSAGEEQVIRDV